jgi:hypothetical protein
MSQTTAAVFCDALALSFGGGWRLPTPDELVLLCYAKPTLPACVQGLEAGLYWSSNVDSFDTRFGGAVLFDSSGFDCTRYSGGRSTEYRVRCVRSSTFPASP